MQEVCHMTEQTDIQAILQPRTAPKLTPGQKLEAWLNAHGWTLTALANAWGTQKSFPGKCLVQRVDPLPEDKRRWLLDQTYYGRSGPEKLPEELLPPRKEKKERKRAPGPLFRSPFADLDHRPAAQ
jgi:hypothetical protein